jgi:phosphoribosyl-AMP cyclohydrolase
VSSIIIQDLTFNEDGLIPAIIQDETSGRVIMFAWMNSASLAVTIKTGETVFFSRSRQEIWHKGSKSGNTQKISRIEVDCDSDSLLITVRPNGPACHTGSTSCFDSNLIDI